jgi:hypothetical protein
MIHVKYFIVGLSAFISFHAFASIYVEPQILNPNPLYLGDMDDATEFSNAGSTPNHIAPSTEPASYPAQKASVAECVTRTLETDSSCSEYSESPIAYGKCMSRAKRTARKACRSTANVTAQSAPNAEENLELGNE